jgi:hypothetical protein
MGEINSTALAALIEAHGGVIVDGPNAALRSATQRSRESCSKD